MHRVTSQRLVRLNPAALYLSDQQPSEDSKNKSTLHRDSSQSSTHTANRSSHCNKDIHQTLNEYGQTEFLNSSLRKLDPKLSKPTDHQKSRTRRSDSSKSACQLIQPDKQSSAFQSP